jgi:DNA-binding transcriptional MerR regulator
VTKIKQNATSQATVDLWGGKIRIAFEQDTDIITLRISARNAAAYANQHETGREVFKDHRDIHLLDALPSNLFEKGSGGDRARGAHGVVTLDYSDLPNSGGKHGLIGYAVYLGTTLFLFVMDSAAKGNLPPWPGDPAKQKRNAFTETVVGAAVDLYEAGSRHLTLRFAFWSRFDRNELFGSRLRDVVSARPGMELWNAHELVGLHKPSDTLINSIKSAESVSQVTAFKESTFIGCINHLRGGEWDHNESYLPLGYRFDRVLGADGETVIKKGAVVVDERHKVALIELVEMAAAGKSWAAIGRRASELKVPLRGPSKRGKTFADLPKNGVMPAAKTLIGNPAYVSLWRSGTMTVRRTCGVKGAKNIREYVLSFEPNSTFGHIDTLVTWPLPVGGWGVSDSTWDKLLARLDAEVVKAGERKAPRGAANGERPRRAFSGSPSFTLNDYEYRLVPETPTAYRLRRRNKSDGLDSRGQARGWRHGEGEAVATFNGLAFHSSVSVALEAALVALAENDVELGAISVTSTEDHRKVENNEANAATLDEEAKKLEAGADALDELAIEAKIKKQGKTATSYVAKAEAKRDEAEAKHNEATKLRLTSEAEPERDEPVALDLSNPVIVAVALSRFDQHVPASLVNALVTLGITESLRINLSDDETVGQWTAMCHVPVIGSDETASLDLHGTVPNTRPAVGAKPGQCRVFTDQVARQFLVEEMDLNTIAKTYHRSSEWARVQVHGWLRDHGITAYGLPNAVLGCPVNDTKRAIYAACTGDRSVVADLAPEFVEHIKATYLDGPGMISWTPGSWTRQRRILVTLAASPTGTALKHDIVAALGVTPRNLAEVARGWSKKAPILERVGAVEIRLVLCPHVDCTGHRRFLTQYLVTPETPNGLICTSCRRTPDRADVMFPTEYLLPWDGPIVSLGVAPGPAEIAVANLLTERQAGEKLGCSDNRVRANLAADRHVGKVAYYRSADVDVKRSDLAGPVNAATRRATNTLGQSLYTTTDAARAFGISETMVRKLIDGDVVPARRDLRGANGREWRLIDQAGMNALHRSLTPADLATDLIGINAAAAHLGITAQALRAAGDAGNVKFQRTSGNTRRYSIADLDEYACTLPRVVRIGSGEAAAHLGISTDALLDAVERGDIKCHRTQGGHRRYSSDLDEYAQTIVKSVGTTEALARLGITVRALRAAGDAGNVKFQRTSGNTRRYSIADLDEYACTLSRVVLIGSVEAAAHVGISTGALRAAGDSKDIKFHRTPGGHRRYSIPDLDEYAPISVKTVGTGEAAARLGISVRALRAAADNGDVKCLRTPSGRRFSISDLDEYASPLIRTVGRIGTGEAAARLGISVRALRAAADKGDVKCLRTPSFRRFSISDLDEYASPLIRTVGRIGTGEAAARLAVSAGALRAAADSGDVKCLRSPGGGRRFSISDLDEFASTLIKPLDTAGSAVHLGITARTLRAAADKGDVKCHRTPSGRRFSISDLDEFASTLTPADLNDTLLKIDVAAERVRMSTGR